MPRRRDALQTASRVPRGGATAGGGTSGIHPNRSLWDQGSRVWAGVVLWTRPKRPTVRGRGAAYDVDCETAARLSRFGIDRRSDGALPRGARADRAAARAALRRGLPGAI